MSRTRLVTCLWAWVLVASLVAASSPDGDLAADLGEEAPGLTPEAADFNVKACALVAKGIQMRSHKQVVYREEILASLTKRLVLTMRSTACSDLSPIERNCRTPEADKTPSSQAEEVERAFELKREAQDAAKALAAQGVSIPALRMPQARAQKAAAKVTEKEKAAATLKALFPVPFIGKTKPKSSQKHLEIMQALVSSPVALPGKALTEVDKAAQEQQKLFPKQAGMVAEIARELDKGQPGVAEKHRKSEETKKILDSVAKTKAIQLVQKQAAALEEADKAKAKAMNLSYADFILKKKKGMSTEKLTNIHGTKMAKQAAEGFDNYMKAPALGEAVKEAKSLMHARIKKIVKNKGKGKRAKVSAKVEAALEKSLKENKKVLKSIAKNKAPTDEAAQAQVSLLSPDEAQDEAETQAAEAELKVARKVRVKAEKKVAVLEQKTAQDDITEATVAAAKASTPEEKKAAVAAVAAVAEIQVAKKVKVKAEKKVAVVEQKAAQADMNKATVAAAMASTPEEKKAAEAEIQVATKVKVKAEKKVAVVEQKAAQVDINKATVAAAMASTPEEKKAAEAEIQVAKKVEVKAEKKVAVVEQHAAKNPQLLNQEANPKAPKVHKAKVHVKEGSSLHRKTIAAAAASAAAASTPLNVQILTERKKAAQVDVTKAKDAAAMASTPEEKKAAVAEIQVAMKVEVKAEKKVAVVEQKAAQVAVSKATVAAAMASKPESSSDDSSDEPSEEKKAAEAELEVAEKVEAKAEKKVAVVEEKATKIPQLLNQEANHRLASKVHKAKVHVKEGSSLHRKSQQSFHVKAGSILHRKSKVIYAKAGTSLHRKSQIIYAKAGSSLHRKSKVIYAKTGSSLHRKSQQSFHAKAGSSLEKASQVINARAGTSLHKASLVVHAKAGSSLDQATQIIHAKAGTSLAGTHLHVKKGTSLDAMTQVIHAKAGSSLLHAAQTTVHVRRGTSLHHEAFTTAHVKKGSSLDASFMEHSRVISTNGAEMQVCQDPEVVKVVKAQKLYDDQEISIMRRLIERAEKAIKSQDCCEMTLSAAFINSHRPSRTQIKKATKGMNEPAEKKLLADKILELVENMSSQAPSKKKRRLAREFRRALGKMPLFQLESIEQTSKTDALKRIADKIQLRQETFKQFSTEITRLELASKTAVQLAANHTGTALLFRRVPQSLLKKVTVAQLKKLADSTDHKQTKQTLETELTTRSKAKNAALSTFMDAQMKQVKKVKEEAKVDDDKVETSVALSGFTTKQLKRMEEESPNPETTKAIEVELSKKTGVSALRKIEEHDTKQKADKMEAKELEIQTAAQTGQESTQLHQEKKADFSKLQKALENGKSGGKVSRDLSNKLQDLSNKAAKDASSVNSYSTGELSKRSDAAFAQYQKGAGGIKRITPQQIKTLIQGKKAAQAAVVKSAYAATKASTPEEKKAAEAEIQVAKKVKVKAENRLAKAVEQKAAQDAVDRAKDAAMASTRLKWKAEAKRSIKGDKIWKAEAKNKSSKDLLKILKNHVNKAEPLQSKILESKRKISGLARDLHQKNKGPAQELQQQAQLKTESNKDLLKILKNHVNHAEPLRSKILESRRKVNDLALEKRGKKGPDVMKQLKLKAPESELQN